MRTLIIYHTKTGHTLEAIRPFADTLKEAGAEARIVLAKDFTASMLTNFDSFVIGTPCWGGSSGVTGVAIPIISAVKKLSSDALQDRLCGGIVVHARYGGKATMSHVERLLRSKGCTNSVSGPVVKAGTLGSVFKGRSVTKQDEELIRAYGKEFINCK